MIHPVDYGQLIADAVNDPLRSYLDALKAEDTTSLAILSVVDPGLDSEAAPAKLRAFVAHYGATAVSAAVVLAIIEGATQFADQLVQAAETILEQRSPRLPLDDDKSERVRALILDREQAETRRTRLLAWLKRSAPKAARAAALAILGDPNEPYNELSRQAISLLVAQRNREVRERLCSYAERHLQKVEEGSEEPERRPEAALFVLKALEAPRQDDLPLIGRILDRAAAQNLQIDGQLDSLFRGLNQKQIAYIIQHLEAEESPSWAADQLVPRLIDFGPATVAGSAAEDWWPSECLAVLANTPWQSYDERLYSTVLEQLHRTKDEAARAAIRQNVAQYCQQTSSQAADRMPRIGARSLLKLSLRGTISPTDPDLLAALQALDVEVRTSEIIGVRWKASERAGRMGEVVSQVDGALLPDVLAKALDEGPRTAVALAEGAGATLIEQQVDDVLEVVGENEVVLTEICRISEAAAARTLERWQSEQSMVAFRALESTSHADGRLSTIPAAVRSYRVRSSAERAELLAALGPRNERVDLLASMLADRSNPPGNKPTTEDLLEALRLLGEHLDQGLDPDQVVDAIGVICREAKQPVIRREAYEALGKSNPAAGLVHLLVERNEEEAPPAKPAAQAALDRMADKLDKLAADPAVGGRAEATELLARIDRTRAVQHARDLIASEGVKDRMLAARLLGSGGSHDDVEKLESASLEEPNREVRDEMNRAIRRLLIGDSAAAHERISEMAKISDPESWLAMNPSDVYGPWVEPIVTGLNRVAEAESAANFGGAIDALDEVAKALLFRTIELAGDEVGVNPGRRAQAARNELDYGDVVGWQQLTQKWRPVRHFGSLHELRTVHIAAKGSVTPPPERTSEDLSSARSLFGLGARHCCETIRRSIT